jgi:hypothetical protein
MQNSTFFLFDEPNELDIKLNDFFDKTQPAFIFFFSGHLPSIQLDFLGESTLIFTFNFYPATSIVTRPFPFCDGLTFAMSWCACGWFKTATVPLICITILPFTDCTRLPVIHNDSTLKKLQFVTHVCLVILPLKKNCYLLPSLHGDFSFMKTVICLYEDCDFYLLKMIFAFMKTAIFA